MEEKHRDPVYKFRVLNIVEDISEPESPVPKARSGHRIVYYNGRIFSFGGYNPKTAPDDPEMQSDPFWMESLPLFKELWEYNLSTRVWSKIPIEGEIPDQLASHTAGLHPALRGYMIVYGGTGTPFGTDTSTSILACNLANGTFFRIPLLKSQGEPMKLYGQAIVIDKAGIMYTVGGTSGFQYFMDVNMIDLTSDEPMWEKISSGLDENEPHPRYRHELCLYKDRLYVLGGGTSSQVCGFQNIDTFSLEERLWSITKTEGDKSTTIDMGDGNGYPDARRCHGLVQIDNLVWIIGGYDGNDVFSNVWRLDLDTMQWLSIEVDLPTPVYFHGVTSCEEGRMVIFGGCDDILKNTRTNKVYSAWLKIPSLRCMSWEAVKYYIPKIGLVQTSKLRELGVPDDLIKMLRNEQAEIG